MTIRAALPWGEGLDLTALSNRGELPQILSLSHRFDDGKQVTLQPGDTMTGDFHLDDRIPNLQQTLRTSDVTLAWVFQLYDSARRVKGGVVSGIVRIPRRNAP